MTIVIFMMMYFCPQTRSPSLKHTLSAQRRLNKNVQNRTFYNGIGGGLTGLRQTLT